jgi:hypothetical protein
VQIYDLYSKRRRDGEKASRDDVFQYDIIPPPVRVQIRKILTDGLGKSYRAAGGGLVRNNFYTSMCQILCREYGLDRLGSGTYEYDNLMLFIDSCSTDYFLDVVELGCRFIDRVVRKENHFEVERWDRTKNPDDLLDEVNYRFRRAGIGYRYESGMLLRIDSNLIHSEVTKPALRLLAAYGFEGPEEEFLNAHEHFRHGRQKETITEAAKAFESMMKAVCDRKGWPYAKGARASDLLKVLRTHRLWPDYLDRSFDQLLATLASGLPQVRNDDGAHGQGSTRREVPDYLAAYALHLAASHVVLLAEAAAKIPDAIEALEVKAETV